MSTGVPSSAQPYIHWAWLSVMWAQPWLRVQDWYWEPGPSVESACQAASWKASPLVVKKAVHWTVVSGYQYVEPWGQGECILNGCSRLTIFMGPKSVP